MSDDKTRAEYEEIKSRWQTMGGTVEDRAYVEDATGKAYRYLTLREETSMDPDAVEEAVARAARLAVLDNAYLTMNVHPSLGRVTIHVGVATYDVPQHARTCERMTHPAEFLNSAHPCDCGLDPPPYVVQTPTPPEVETDFERAGDPTANVAREMLADDDATLEEALDAHGFVAVPTDPDLCQCGEPRAHHWHADQGVTPSERGSLGVGGGEV